MNKTRLVPKYFGDLDFIVGAKDAVIDETRTHDKQNGYCQVFDERPFFYYLAFKKKSQKKNERNAYKNTDKPKRVNIHI